MICKSFDLSQKCMNTMKNNEYKLETTLTVSNVHLATIIICMAFAT